MSGKWQGGKGDARRKKADDKKYREGWDRIFKGKNKSNGDNKS